MSRERIRVLELRPRPLPCAHDRSGVRHKHLSELLACIEKFGTPGFDALPVEGPP